MNLKEKILKLLELKKSVLFDELEERFPELKGNTILCPEGNKNLVIWLMSNKGTKIIEELSKENLIEVHPNPSEMGIASYFAGGRILNLPLAKKLNYPYKKPHWVPSSLSLVKSKRKS